MQIQAVRHATIIITMMEESLRLLVDPMFSAKATLPAVPGVACQLRNPLTDLPCPVEELINCDAIFLTHLHEGHYDKVAAKILPKDVPVFCQPEDEQTLRRDGFLQVIPLTAGKPYRWNDISIVRVPAFHGYDDVAEKMDPVSGFIFNAECEPVVYVIGDSVWCDAVADTIKAHRPQVIICNGGGTHFSTGRPITMNAPDVAALRRAAPEATIIVMHMECWNHCAVTRDGLRSYLAERGLLHNVIIPRNGKIVRQ